MVVFSNLLSSTKDVLSSLEKVIPLRRPQVGEIDQDVTENVQKYTSPSFLETLMNQLLIDTPDIEQKDQAVTTAGDISENDIAAIRIQLGRYWCEEEVQTSLREFIEILHTHWPTQCRTAHRSALRLTACRKYEQMRVRRAEALIFDTLSSGHEVYWGRVQFVKRLNPRTTTIKFSESSAKMIITKDEVIVDSESTPSVKHIDLGPIHSNREAICKAIENASTDSLIQRIDLHDFTIKHQLGKGVRSSENMITLRELFAPTSMAESEAQEMHHVSISPLEKANLALILGCTYHQLCTGAWGATESERTSEGPWLDRDWAKHGICFAVNSENKPEITEPYLPIITDNGYKTATFGFYNSSIVALAIDLIHLQDPEVLHKLESIKTELVRRGGKTVATDYCAVLDLIETETFKNNVDEQCQRAIQALIEGDFFGTDEDEDEMIVQKYFLSQVLAPLKMSYDVAENTKARLDSTSMFKKSQKQRHFNNGKSLQIGTVKRRETSVDEEHTHQAEMTSSHLPNLAPAFFTEGFNHDEWLKQLKILSNEIKREVPRGIEIKPIRVAILDTGINMSTPFFTSEARRLKVQARADFTVNGSRATSDIDNDTFKHGSLMAQLLLEAAPSADVYIARIAENTNALSHSIAAIIKGIQWAVEQKVDIISMSFGFPKWNDEISRAIYEAQLRCDQQIIFLAAAGNSPSENKKFPASHPSVISIYATSCRGALLFDPPIQKIQEVIGTFGDNIPERFRKAYGDKICQPGSSVATVIAAAIAAMMLMYIRALPSLGLNSQMDKKTSVEKLEERCEELKDLQKFRTTKGMSELFVNMAPNRIAMTRWINPFWFWGDRNTTESRKTLLKKVADEIVPVTPSKDWMYRFSYDPEDD